jgi:Cu/Ag efflux protein CusF
MKKLFITLAVLATTSLTAALAATVPIAGEVKKINVDQNKITLKHEPITNLDMGPMTMVFAVADPEMLKKVAVGDKVIFEADRVKGKLTITAIEKAK